MPFSNFHYFESVTPIFLIFFCICKFYLYSLLMYDCTQGKKVTCLLKPGMKTGKNHSLNDVNLI